MEGQYEWHLTLNKLFLYFLADNKNIYLYFFLPIFKQIPLFILCFWIDRTKHIHSLGLKWTKWMISFINKKKSEWLVSACLNTDYLLKSKKWEKVKWKQQHRWAPRLWASTTLPSLSLARFSPINHPSLYFPFSISPLNKTPISPKTPKSTPG